MDGDFDPDDLDPVTASFAKRTWTVEKDDTLWEISRIMLGDPTRFGEIARLNNITINTGSSNQYNLQVGQVLNIPATSQAQPFVDMGAGFMNGRF